MTEVNANNSNYPQPSPEFMADMRKRLADIPQDVLERFHHALIQEHIDRAGSILYRAGLCLCSAELYEYRKTLFPPNSLVDPLTQGPPVLRNAPTVQLPLQADGRTADSLSGSRTASCPSVAPPPSSQCNSSLQGQDSSGQALLNDLRDVLKRYVVLPEMTAETLALWVVHTYAFTLRQVTTYIGVVSPEKRCGKTTLLELLGRLANRSLTAANISPSAMFRLIEETQPTLLIDEADTFLEGRDELAGILNAGYRKGNSYVVRVAERKARHNHGGTSCTSPKNHSIAEFGEWTNQRADGSPAVTEFAQYSCWCPKVMAAIGRLPDTLADRCIIVTMQRKLVGEKCERMRHLNATELRKHCAQFVSENSARIAEAQPEIPQDLNDRAADIWEPLLAIADIAGGQWPELARQAAQKLSGQDDELTLTGYFLKDLRNLMVLANVDRMLSRDIVARLNPMHDRPWEDLRRGREINEWWLGRLLSELGVRSRSTRVNDATGKGYALADIEAAFRRYVPNPDLHSQPTVAEHLAGDINLSKTQETQIEARFDKLMNKLLASLPKDP